MSDNEQQPEKKKNWYERYAAAVKRIDRKLFAPFYRTKLGKKWTAWDDSLDKNKYGKLIRIGVSFAIVLAVGIPVRALVYNMVSNSYDVQLTQEQKDAGYDVTIHQRSKIDTPDDIGYRFITEDESMNTPECSMNEICWDIKLLPLVKNCTSISVVMNFYETDDFLAQPLDTAEKTFTPESRAVFYAGTEYDQRMGTTNEKVMYASMDRAYCAAFGN